MKTNNIDKKCINLIKYSNNFKKNVFISINPDAHSITGIHDIKYGVDMASKGKLQKEHCLNACDVFTFLTRIKK